MANIPFITAQDVEQHLSWNDVMAALREGHRHDRAQIDDILFKQGVNSVLNRAAWVSGVGIGIKTATIFPHNQNQSPALANINALFTLFEDQTGLPTAVVDGTLLTKWKTAGDSILGSTLLARPDSQVLTILGAGAVAESLIDAYSAAFPGLQRICLWNRTHSKANALAQKKSTAQRPVTAFTSLTEAIGQADIISSATMTTEPFIEGEWIRPGTHIDLIGAYRPDMREATDSLLRKARIFCDARETTIHDIGEFLIPLTNGVITENDIQGDFYDLCNGGPGRLSDQEITLFKNGGGAHLDLMTATYLKATCHAQGCTRD